MSLKTWWLRRTRCNHGNHNWKTEALKTYNFGMRTEAVLLHRWCSICLARSKAAGYLSPIGIIYKDPIWSTEDEERWNELPAEHNIRRKDGTWESMGSEDYL